MTLNLKIAICLIALAATAMVSDYNIGILILSLKSLTILIITILGC